MFSLTTAITFDEFATAIERLSQELDRKRTSGPLSFQDVQQAASELTKAQLALNELERVELRDRGASRDMAERYSQLENRVRTLQEDIFHEMQRPRPAPGDGA